MGSIMLSYSRRDEAVVKLLVQGLEAAKRQVWHDADLGGGDVWWNSILAAIRTSPVFLFALSNAALLSKPCRLELDYALALGRPILPVQVGPVTALRASPIAELQIITYSPNRAESGFAVLAAVEEAERRVQPLPDPLPVPPPIPFAYLLALGRQIDNSELGVAEQVTAVDQLRRALGEETDESVQQDILAVLRNLKSKPWTTKRTERDITALLYASSLALDEDVRESMPAAGPAPDAERRSTGAGGGTRVAPAESASGPGAPQADKTGAAAAEPSPPADHARAAGPTTGPTRSAAPAPSPLIEDDPREWFAERLEEANRQRAEQERAMDPDPPPWRMSPDAAGRWEQSFEAGASDGGAAESPAEPGPGGASRASLLAGGRHSAQSGAWPQTGRSHAGQPQTGQPQTGRSHAGQPQTGQPQTGQPQAGASAQTRQQQAGPPRGGAGPPGDSAAGHPPPGLSSAGPPSTGRPFSWAPPAQASGRPSASSASEPEAEADDSAESSPGGTRRRSVIPRVWVIVGIALLAVLLLILI